MSSGFKKSLIALSVSGLLASPAVFATNGYFGHGYSTKEKGLAGAGVAYSQDSLAAATNPAGMVQKLPDRDRTIDMIQRRQPGGDRFVQLEQTILHKL